jgi:hypothetical protein
MAAALKAAIEPSVAPVPISDASTERSPTRGVVWNTPAAAPAMRITSAASSEPAAWISTSCHHDRIVFVSAAAGPVLPPWQRRGLAPPAGSDPLSPRCAAGPVDIDDHIAAAGDRRVLR